MTGFDAIINAGLAASGGVVEAAKQAAENLLKDSEKKRTPNTNKEETGETKKVLDNVQAEGGEVKKAFAEIAKAMDTKSGVSDEVVKLLPTGDRIARSWDGNNQILIMDKDQGKLILDGKNPKIFLNEGAKIETKGDISTITFKNRDTIIFDKERVLAIKRGDTSFESGHKDKQPTEKLPAKEGAPDPYVFPPRKPPEDDNGILRETGKGSTQKDGKSGSGIEKRQGDIDKKDSKENPVGPEQK